MSEGRHVPLGLRCSQYNTVHQTDSQLSADASKGKLRHVIEYSMNQTYLRHCTMRNTEIATAVSI
jgi:hypothetical protein